MKRIPGVICTILLLAGLTGSGWAQTTLPQVKQTTVAPSRTLPGTIDKNLVLQSQPKVIVATLEVKNITSSTATCYYNVKFEGLTLGTDIKASTNGVCINKATMPTINNTKFGISKNCAYTTNGCSDMTGLTPGMKYYVRAFYTITEGKITGTFYGNELTFTTLAPSK